jgi:hypothetical protein
LQGVLCEMVNAKQQMNQGVSNQMSSRFWY